MATQTPQDSMLTTRRLGDSDLFITSIGLGAWAMGGGDWQYSWGPQEDEDSIEAIRRAVDLGLNWIDTAAIYGLGHSEEVVGRALQHSSKKPYVFTKCSMRWDAKGKIFRGMKEKSVREELHDSLRRLRSEVVDLYQIHWPDPAGEVEEGWATLAKLKEEGKIRYIGVSNFTVKQMSKVGKIAPITSLQPPFSLINAAIEREILPFCALHNIGVINYSPMASGLLTGKMSAERLQHLPPDDWRHQAPQFKEPQLSRNLKLAELLRDIGRPHNVEAGVVAIAWTLHHPEVTAAIVGVRNTRQVEGIFPAASFRLTDQEFQRLESFRKADGNGS